MNFDAHSTAHSTTDALRIVVAAGGTGGHIFPAVAVVEALERLTDHRVDALFLGSQDRMETTLIPHLGYKYVGMPIEGFKGLRSASTLRLPLRIMQSIRVAAEAIRTHRPHAVICTGAYISYPAGIAAQRARVPLFVLESNLNPGKTNKRLAGYATAMLLTFEETREMLPPRLARHLHVVGNPVRQQIFEPRDRQEARRKWNLPADGRVVLVFGGSLGARSINTAIHAGLQRMVDHGYSVLWQTGKGYHVNGAVPAGVTVTPFIDDMGSAYAAADLVVCRSGATSIAELGIVGKPAILVPLPSASTDEQRHNARAVEKRGAGVVVDDADTAELLVDTILRVVADTQGFHRMGQAMLSLGKPHAAEDAAQLILDASGWHHERRAARLVRERE